MKTCSECGSVEIEEHSPYSTVCVFCGVKHLREFDAEWLRQLPRILRFSLRCVPAYEIHTLVEFLWKNREQDWK